MLTSELKDHTLYLTGALQVHHLEGIKDVLMTLVNEEYPLTVEVSRIEDLDIAGLQILLSFLRSRKSETKIAGITPDMARAIEIIGLKPYLASYMQ
jgi:ABC-type transporter Mla MlaB component